jgi:thiosulfate/3-mercaptopyruvate sulfurtransferase
MVARLAPESPLVSAEWLKSHLSAPDVRVLDATYMTTFRPGEAQTGGEAYAAHHIPGARFFDIDDIADTTNPLPHMLPSPEKFASRARRLGLGDGHRIICYDQNNYMASARVWWMFRTMGHDDVAVLDGGFEAWKSAGGDIEDLPPTPHSDRHFTVRMRSDLVRNLEQVGKALETGSAQVLDARSAARFTGAAEEPRPGLRRGHMAGALNLPYTRLLAPDGRFLPVDEMRSQFASSGVDLTRPIVNTCGSGVTAAVLALAEAICGCETASVYDGSWCEWGDPASGAPVASL